MSKTWLAVAAGIVGMMAVGVTAAEKPSDEYVQAMKTIGAAMQATNKAITAPTPDYIEASLNAQKIVAAFEVVQKYWKDKDADAFKLAETASKSASDLAVTAGMGFNTAAVPVAAKQLAATCGTCHMAHRERLPDGTFEIK